MTEELTIGANNSFDYRKLTMDKRYIQLNEAEKNFLTLFVKSVFFRRSQVAFLIFSKNIFF